MLPFTLFCQHWYKRSPSWLPVWAPRDAAIFFRSLPTDNFYFKTKQKTLARQCCIWYFWNTGFEPRCHRVLLVLDTQINGNIAFIFWLLCPSASSLRPIYSFAMPATSRCTEHAGTVCLTERIPNRYTDVDCMKERVLCYKHDSRNVCVGPFHRVLVERITKSPSGQLPATDGQMG